MTSQDIVFVMSSRRGALTAVSLLILLYAARGLASVDVPNLLYNKLWVCSGERRGAGWGVVLDRFWLLGGLCGLMAEGLGHPDEVVVTSIRRVCSFRV